MALSSPHLSFCLLIFIIYACTNSQTIYSLNPLIHQVCAQTAFEPFCVRFLSLHPRSAEATDKHALGLIALERVERYARITVNRIKNNLLTNIRTPPAMKEKLEKCKEEYNFIIHDTVLAYRYWTSNLKNAIPITKNSASANKAAVHACRRAVGVNYQPLAAENMETERIQDILLTICDFNPPRNFTNV